jgi:hypothetical protein
MLAIESFGKQKIGSFGKQKNGQPIQIGWPVISLSDQQQFRSRLPD